MTLQELAKTVPSGYYVLVRKSLDAPDNTWSIKLTSDDLLVLRDSSWALLRISKNYGDRYQFAILSGQTGERCWGFYDTVSYSG